MTCLTSIALKTVHLNIYIPGSVFNKNVDLFFLSPCEPHEVTEGPQASVACQRLASSYQLVSKSTKIDSILY